MENNKWMPKTTTQEMLEKGQAKQKTYTKICKKALNFQTYPMNDFRFDNMAAEISKEMPVTTTYERDYAAPYSRICVTKLSKENVPDRFWNRKPLNDFALQRSIASEFKFMDDHFINVTEQRKRVNFFRQLRNQHYPLV